MKTIWKFAVELTDEQTIEMPLGGRVLSAQCQRGAICLWAAVDTCAPHLPLAVRICGTGNPLPDLTGLRFVDTVQAGPFVWHIFVEATP